MRTTASYELFPDAPSERAMARARYLVREGRVADAEKAYRDLLAEHPDLKPGWVEFDPDLALVWHELGYAAFRLGDRNRALLALDRAFALEPHTETLRLRGRILRDAGRYQAAEVAYEGAAQAAEHAEQRAAAEREIGVTQRYAFYAPRRPDELTSAERWFAETGTVVLASQEGTDVPPPDDAALAAAFLDLARDSGWRFGQVVTLGPALPVWRTLADALRAPLVGGASFDPAACPLVVAQRPQPADAGWSTLTASVAERATGLVFVLEHVTPSVPLPEPTSTAADVIGVFADPPPGGRRPQRLNVAHALSEAQHPAGRLAHRRLVRE